MNSISPREFSFFAEKRQYIPRVGKLPLFTGSILVDTISPSMVSFANRPS